MPHRHIGVSMFDLVKDLQEIKSMIQRGLIDGNNSPTGDAVMVDEASGNVVVQDDVFNRSRIATVVVCGLTSNLRPGEELFRFATISDLHVGEFRFGFRATMIELIPRVTGCKLRDSTLQGDSGEMRGSIDCPKQP